MHKIIFPNGVELMSSGNQAILEVAKVSNAAIEYSSLLGRYSFFSAPISKG
jgi:hypothetical protein